MKENKFFEKVREAWYYDKTVPWYHFKGQTLYSQAINFLTNA